MGDVWIVGSYTTAFGQFPDRSFLDLTRAAHLGVLRDAGIEDQCQRIGSVWFGNVVMDFWGQHSTRGQFCLVPLVEEGLLPNRVPVINVEAGCATGSVAFQGAIKDIRSGDCDLSLAIGVEKMFRPDVTRAEAFGMFRAGENSFDPDRTLNEYRKLSMCSGVPFELGPGRTMFMDTYAALAAYHMKKYGTTQRQLAYVAAKNHCNGVLNAKAQYRFQMTVDEVLNDRLVTYPLTRSMCAPIGDGAAAALLCSDAFLNTLPPRVRDRAVRVAASTLTSGIYREPDTPSLTRVAADEAYGYAGIDANQVDLAEVHDATAFGEIFQSEMLRFCPDGDGGLFVESGATALNGAIPINTSGGLESKGHPVGASGLSMISEIVVQLRGEAGSRQVPRSRIGLIQNGGGIMGLEEAACAVTILERAR